MLHEITRKVGFVAVNPVKMVIEIDCDEITANELVLKVFPGIAKIVHDGAKRERGDDDWKPNGCGC